MGPKGQPKPLFVQGFEISTYYYYYHHRHHLISMANKHHGLGTGRRWLKFPLNHESYTVALD